MIISFPISEKPEVENNATIQDGEFDTQNIFFSKKSTKILKRGNHNLSPLQLAPVLESICHAKDVHK